MARLKKEHLRGLYLDTRNKLLRDEIISIGTLNASLAYPRDVFSPALESHAAAVIIIHNHPSGDPSPSKDDVELTKRLYQASKILAVDFLDHVIIGDERYVSLREKTDIWKEA
jgi:DNA repair protein RadC